MDRREFFQLLAGLSVGASLPGVGAAPPVSDRIGPCLPMRTLGKGGPRVTMLGLGGYHIGWTTNDLARKTIETAVEEGIRFFDTAQGYGPETSEIRYGEWLSPFPREELFIMTKSDAKNAALAREHIEGSLRRMRLDHIDLWQLHALKDSEDVKERLGGGVLDEALKAQSEGKIRYIGFTCHTDPAAMSDILRLTSGAPETFLACQFPINPVDAVAKTSFIREVLPRAIDRGLGVLAMKTLADGRFFSNKQMNDHEVWTTEDPVVPDVLSVADCIRFVLTLPVSVALVGAEKPEFVRDKAAIARSFDAISEEERSTLVDKVARFATAAQVEYYKPLPLRG